MTEMTTISKVDLANLEERVKKLAADKSYLQLIIRMMSKMNAVPGLDNTVENMLRNVVDVIGGTNVILYYMVDGGTYYADVYGERKKLNDVTDGPVKKVMETREPIESEHEFSDSKMLVPEFSKAYTWIVPLLVGSELVGVFKMESLNIAMRDAYQQLPTFFTYAALVLKNEILGQTQLKQAYDRLEQEMVVRQQAEEKLRQSNESLEERVAERTAELQNVNEQLNKNEKQIESLLDKSEASRRALVSILEDEKQVEAALRRERALLSRIMETSPVGITMVNRDGQVTFANPQAEQVLGLTKDEITLRMYNAPEWRITDYAGAPFPDEELPFQRVISTGQPVHDVQHAIMWPDGRSIFLSVNGAPTLNESGEVESVVFTIEDITERKQADETLRRLNRELHAISNCNQILMRAVDEQTLLSDICRIICDEAGYHMAWAGYAENDEAKTVRPVAWAGKNDGYLANANITWADTERGRGPTGIAIRSGESICIQDFTTDPQATPWWDNALQRGYRSSIALPLKDESANTFGVLNIYSAEPNAFTPDEIRLLEELAGDLAFGVTALRTRTERKRAEEALQERERHSQSLLRLSRNLERAETYTEALNAARNEVRTIIGYQNLWAYLLTDDKKYLKALIAGGSLEEIVMSEEGTATLKIEGDRMLEEIAAAKEIVIVEDARTDARTNKEIVAMTGTVTIVNIPIILFDRHLGAIGTGTVSDEGVRAPTKLEQEYLMALASHIAVTFDRIHLLIERKRTEEEMRLLSAIVQSSDDAIISKNETGIILSWNRAAERLYGYSADEAVGKSITIILPPEREDEFLKIINQLNRGETVEHYETERVRRNGERVSISLTMSPIEDVSGKIIGVSSIARDITERKKNEEQLRASALYARSLIEASLDPLVTISPDGKIMDVNQATETVTGVPRERLVGDDFSNYFTEPENAKAGYQKALTEGWVRDYPLTIRHTSEKTTDVLYNATVYKNEKGDIQGVFAAARDITERKRAEEALRESEQKYRRLVEYSPYCIHQVNRQGYLISMNPVGLQMMGVQDECEIQGMPYLDSVASEDKERINQLLTLALQGQSSEFEFKASNGHIFQSSFVPITDADGVVLWLMGLTLDITERKRAEEALRESEQKFRNFIEQSSEGFTLVDEQGFIIEWNHAREKITGLPASQAIGKAFWDVQYQMLLPELKTPNRHERNRQITLDALQTGQSPIFDNVIETQVMRQDGESRFVQQIVFPIKTDKGYRIGSVTSDITERKRAEEALRASETKFRAVFENSVDAIGVSKAGIHIFVNPAYLALFGYADNAELNGKSILDLIAPSHREQVLENVRHRTSGQAAPAVYETRGLRKDGSEFDMDVHMSTYELNGEIYSVPILRDITKRKRAEAEIQALAKFPNENPNPVLRITKDGILLYANRASADLIQCWNCSIGERLPEFWYTLILDALDSGLLREEEMVCRERIFTLMLAPIIEGDYVNLYGRDITERKQVEEAFRQSEERFRRLAENARDVIYRMSLPDGKYEYVSPAALSVFGYSPQECYETPILIKQAIHPDWHKYFEEQWENLIKGEMPPTYEYQFIHKLGEVRWLNQRNILVRDDAGAPIAIEGIVTDITERKQAENALRESERRYRDIFDNVLDGLYLLDVTEDGRFRTVEVNPALEQMTGVPRSFSVGKTQEETVPTESVAIVNAKYRHCVEAGHPIEEEVELDLPAGRRYFHSTLIPTRDETGRISRIIGISRDITERKQAEEALRSSEAGLKEAQRLGRLGSWDWDAKADTITWSEEYYHIYGFDPTQRPPGYEEHLKAYTPESAAQLDAAVKRNMETGEPYELDLELVPTDGPSRWITARSETKHDQNGQIVGLRGTAQDITERKRAEEKIRALNQDLEQRVLIRTAQLEDANKELEAFAYSVSHDLRAPLRHIDGFIEMLQNRTKTTLDGQSQHYMEVISDSARKMGTLIDDLLSFSRMGRNEMSKSQVDMDELVQDVIKEFKPETEGRDVQWKISPLPLITGDRAMLRVVLVNLISNALKFTRPRKIARIKIGCEKKNKTEVVIFVRDNGVGFDMNYVDKLFGVFQRLHRQEDFEGTGIGLANVRRVISRHGGRTWADGQVDHGATFYFSLPTSK